jgi:hypothetical protein
MVKIAALNVHLPTHSFALSETNSHRMLHITYGYEMLRIQIMVSGSDAIKHTGRFLYTNCVSSVTDVRILVLCTACQC